MFICMETSKEDKEVYCKRHLPQESPNEAVYGWYTQERAEGVPVHGLDIQYYQWFSYHLGHENFTCSNGTSGVVNKAIAGKLLSPDVSTVDL